MPARHKNSSPLFNVRFVGGAHFKTANEREAALTLVRRLVASAGIAPGDLPPVTVALEALSGGRSAAHVFKLTPLFGPRRAAKGSARQAKVAPIVLTPAPVTPVIVKISPPAEGAREKERYEQFAREALPPECRPELLGFVRTRAYSGLCYEFVGRTDGSRADTFTDRLQRGNTETVELVLRNLFEPLRDTWYSATLVKKERDIAQRYLDRHFYGPRSVVATETSLAACAARYFKARPESGCYVIGATSFPSLRDTLFAAKRKHPYRSCIVHGDLNSDNILVADDPARVTLIDFLKTGRGHVYEDLIALEASVRINYPHDSTSHASTSHSTSFEDILEKERLIALGPREAREQWGQRVRNDPYAATIARIRDAALRYFGKAEFEATYPFAVAAIGLRLMLATDLSHAARARITASALWAAKVLADEM